MAAHPGIYLALAMNNKNDNSDDTTRFLFSISLALALFFSPKFFLTGMKYTVIPEPNAI